MVTYGDMFTYTLVLISIVELCILAAQFRNKKKQPPLGFHTGRLLLITTGRSLPFERQRPILSFSIPARTLFVKARFFRGA